MTLFYIFFLSKAFFLTSKKHKIFLFLVFLLFLKSEKQVQTNLNPIQGGQG